MISPVFSTFCDSYVARLKSALDLLPQAELQSLADSLITAWKEKRQVFIFGNGGSAGNAIHLANDYLYGVSRQLGKALRVHALPANSAVLTCLANDEGYESIFIQQLAVLANPGDIAIALSGSGNSPNILRALEYCRDNQIQSFAILGFSGGQAKALADHAIHVPIQDMQISEDLQLVIGHLMMQWLYAHKDQI
jgi:D-sedoheptulose 7-phosphate isomerase